MARRRGRGRQIIDTITPRHGGSRRATNRRTEPAWDPGIHRKDWAGSLGVLP